MSGSPSNIERTTSTDSYMWRTSSRSSQTDAPAVINPDEFNVHVSLANLEFQSHHSQEANESPLQPGSISAKSPSSASESEDTVPTIATTPTASESNACEKVKPTHAKSKKICCTIF